MAALAVDDRPVLPPQNHAQLDDLNRFVRRHPKAPALIGPDDERVPLPDEVYEVLAKVVEAMRQGRAITVAPLEQQLTTQQAAELLGISRPTLVRLLEEKRIPYDQPGRHRKVRLADLLDYRERRRVGRRAALAELTAEAVQAGLYEARGEDYAEALKAARRRHATTSS